MKVVVNSTEEVETLAIVFDETDAQLTDDDRRVIAAAFSAGVASAKALRELKIAEPDPSEEVKVLAPQIFAQSVGLSLGLTFGAFTSDLMSQVTLCARIATLDAEQRAEVLEVMAKAATELRNEKVKH